MTESEKGIIAQQPEEKIRRDFDYLEYLDYLKYQDTQIAGTCMHKRVQNLVEMINTLKKATDAEVKSDLVKLLVQITAIVANNILSHAD